MPLDTLTMILMVLTMAGVTYIIRMIPLIFFRRKITNRFIQSLLYYVPYAVLSAMTFPYIFYSTGNFYVGLIGTGVAIFASLTKKSLLTVAILACLTCLVFGFIIV